MRYYMRTRKIHVQATVDDFATDEEVSAVRAVLAEFGLDAEVRAAFDNHYYKPPAASGLLEASWVIYLSLPIAAFLSGFGAEVAKRLVDQLWPTRKPWRSGSPGWIAPDAPPSGIIVFVDSSTNIQVVVAHGQGERAPSIPLEALATLQELDLSSIERGPLFYDQASGEWW